MTPTPKDRFLADTAMSKWHSDTVKGSLFSVALDAALLEYSAICAQENGPDAGYWKSRGAFEFARLFCELSTPRTFTTRKDLDNLPH